MEGGGTPPGDLVGCLRLHVAVLLSVFGPGGPLRVWQVGGRPAAVNYRVVYRCFVYWRIGPLSLDDLYVRESAGAGVGVHHKDW